MSIKSGLIAATAVAIALTSFDPRPAAAGPLAPPAFARQHAGFDLASARRRRGGGIAPLAAFGAIAGTIIGIAAAQQRREAYERYYGGPYYRGPYYGGPAVYGEPYAEAPAYQYDEPYPGSYGPDPYERR
jgi:hypothetical protein